MSSRNRRWDGPGLRERVTLTFALGAALLLLLVVVVVAVFVISRGYLVDQRERSAGRRAAADADLVRSHLEGPEAAPTDALAAADPPADTVLLLRGGGSGSGPSPMSKPKRCRTNWSTRSSAASS